MQFMKGDTPRKYELTFNIVDNESSMKKLEANPMYEPHEEKYNQAHNFFLAK